MSADLKEKGSEIPGDCGAYTYYDAVRQLSGTQPVHNQAQNPAAEQSLLLEEAIAEMRQAVIAQGHFCYPENSLLDILVEAMNLPPSVVVFTTRVLNEDGTPILHEPDLSFPTLPHFHLGPKNPALCNGQESVTEVPPAKEYLYFEFVRPRGSRSVTQNPA